MKNKKILIFLFIAIILILGGGIYYFLIRDNLNGEKIDDKKLIVNTAKYISLIDIKDIKLPNENGKLDLEKYELLSQTENKYKKNSCINTNNLICESIYIENGKLYYENSELTKELKGYDSKAKYFVDSISDSGIYSILLITEDNKIYYFEKNQKELTFKDDGILIDTSKINILGLTKYINDYNGTACSFDSEAAIKAEDGIYFYSNKSKSLEEVLKKYTPLFEPCVSVNFHLYVDNEKKLYQLNNLEKITQLTDNNNNEIIFSKQIQIDDFCLIISQNNKIYILKSNQKDLELYNNKIVSNVELNQLGNAKKLTITYTDQSSEQFIIEK